jgi:hypothetical protein
MGIFFPTVEARIPLQKGDQESWTMPRTWYLFFVFARLAAIPAPGLMYRK